MTHANPLPDSTANLAELSEFPPDGIYSRILTKSENFSCALICLSASHSIDPHESSGKACIQVIQGRGQLNLDGRSIDLAPGVFVVIPEREAHSITASENLSFLFCLSHLITHEVYKLKRNQQAAA